MKFSSDELMPFFEVRTGMSKHLDDVQAGKEIVITRHGKPVGALLSAAQLYRYRELDRLMVQLLDVLTLRTHLEPAIANKQIVAIVEQVQSVNEHTKKQ